MILDFSRKILDLKGRDIVEDGVAVTLGGVACTALTALLPDEQNLPPQKKVQRFELALIAAKGGEQDITPEQYTELKELIGKCFGSLTVGRAYEIMSEAAK